MPGHRRVRAARVVPALPAFVALLAFLPLPALAAGDLVLIPDPTLLGLLIVFFAVLIYPVNTLIFKPIFSALDERQSRIDGARQRAEHIQGEADKILQRYEEGIREGRAEAETARKEQLIEARAEQASIAAAAQHVAEQKLGEARTSLESALASARGDLRATSEELARAAAERILGRSL